MKKIISLRVDEDVKEKLEKLASDDGRTLSQYIERMVVTVLNGGNPPPKPAVRKKR